MKKYFKTRLMPEEDGLQLALAPVIDGVGQQLHGDGVDTQEVAYEHHLGKITSFQIH